MPKYSNKTPPLSIVAFGAHPDDIEFGCGGVIAAATRGGALAHFVICSQGEAGTRGNPSQRTREAKKGARFLGASCEFLLLDGDARLEAKPAHARALAAIIRRIRPEVVLAPTPAPNQHPDHSRLGRLARDAARLARYGGIAELRTDAVHAVRHLLYYAVTPEAEPPGALPLLFDISEPAVVRAWRKSMQAHASQSETRPYEDLQVARARVFGLRAGVAYATPLYPNDPLILASLGSLARGRALVLK